MKLVRYLTIGLITFVLAVYSLVWLLSPVAVRMAAKKPLAEYGLTLSSDSVVRLNLFNSTLSVQDFVLLHNEAPTYSLDWLHVKYSLLKLLVKEVRIESVELDGMSLLASNNQGEVTVAGVAVPQATEPAVGEPVAEQPEAEEEAGMAVSVNVPEVLLQNLRLTFENLGHAHELKINELRITDTLFNEGALSTALQLDAQLDGMAINLSNRLQLDEQDIQAQVNLQLSSLTPESLLYLLPENIAALNFSSDLELSSDIHFSGNRLNIRNTDLAVALAQLDLQEQQVSAGLETFAFSVSNLAAEYHLDTAFASANGESAIQLAGLAADITATGNPQLTLGSFDSGTIAFDLDSQSLAETLKQFDMESYLTAPASTEAEDEPVPETAASAAATIKPLSISLPKLQLQSLGLSLENQGQVHEVQVDDLQIADTRLNNDTFSTALTLAGQLDAIQVGLSNSISVNAQEMQALVDLNLSNITPESYGYLLPGNITELGFSSDVQLSSEVKLNGGVLNIAGASAALALSALNVQEQRLSAGLQSLSFSLSDVAAEYQLETLVAQATGEASVQLAGLNAAMADSGDTLIKVGSFDSGTVAFDINDQDFSAQLNQLTVESLLASQVMSVDGMPAMLVMDSISVKDVAASNQAVSIATVELGGGRISVIRNAAGELTTLVDTAALSPAESLPGEETEPEVAEQQNAETESAAPAPAIQLGQILLTVPVKISIEDQSNRTPFAKVFELHKADIRSVDSRQPELKTTFDVALKDADYFTLQTDGWVQLFTPEINLAMTATAREFPMNEVAPYLKDTLGFEVKSGQLDADITAEVVADQLDSDVLLLMRGANFAASEASDEGSNFIGQTAIPLNVALNMLKDGDGNIELKIPVNGDINDPSFGLQHVLGLVVKKVVLAQAKNYLLTTLVPYAKVVSVAVVAGEQALKVRFEDLPYAENQIELLAEQTEFADQLATLMTDKPELTVNVCAVAIASESVAAPTAENPQLVLDASAVASARAQTFKSYLVNNYAVASSRLLLCSPEIDNGKEPQSRIKFSVL
ncbi:DUF748 domain-containing protein [Reinekea marinisedimentorum]|nr:DUF748 domain-containing protein [Reinekea marinisedimentorum]